MSICTVMYDSRNVELAIWLITFSCYIYCITISIVCMIHRFVMNLLFYGPTIPNPFSHTYIQMETIGTRVLRLKSFELVYSEVKGKGRKHLNVKPERAYCV
ncbi:hypothetical protein VNO77_18793 [Canavalia gladiata]|uniref:Uncharacterized protein n=1 Tax=Canavalia gladiata TaxID=3824 RepID=A0AAN9LLK6_CANGL